jgi:DNA polymerase-3 subunit beta
MNLTIPRTEFLAALAAVKPVARSNSLPILSNLLLVASTKSGTGSVTLTATDTDLHLRVNLDATVTKDGKTTVCAALLFDIIRMAEGMDVKLELQKNNLIVECGTARHCLATIDPEDFPPFPRIKAKGGQNGHAGVGVNELVLEDSLFRTMLAETSFAASTEEERYILCGNLIKMDVGKLYVVACDGRRFAISSMDSPVAATTKSFILPIKAVRELLRLLGTDTGKPQRLNLTASANLVQFTFSSPSSVSVMIVSKLIEGSYPDYNRLIPAENAIASLPRAEFLRSIERIALVADEVTLEFTGSALHLRSRGKRGDAMVGEASDSLLIPANVPGSIEYTLSTRHLRDTLSVIPDDTLEFHAVPGRPCLFKAPTRDWRAVIAPAKKAEGKKAAKVE